MATLPDRKLSETRMQRWPNMTVGNHGVTSDEVER